MAFLSLLAILILLNVIYTIGFLTAQILTKAHHQHYFLGFNPSLLTFHIRKIKFTLGVYIPIIGLSRVYYVDNSGKKHIFYPWQFTKVSILKRLFLTYSGVLSLFVFGILASIIAVYTSKEQYISKEEVNTYGIYPSAEAREVGFLPGDKVIALNGSDYKDFYELILPDIVQSPETYYTILRGGQEIVIKMTGSAETGLNRPQMFLSLNAPFSVGKVMPESPAAHAEIYEGDKIIKVNSNRVVSLGDMNTQLQSDEDGEVVLEVQRGEGSSLQKFEKVVLLNEDKKLGIFIDEKIRYETTEYSLLQAVTVGVRRFCFNLLAQFKAIKKIIGLSLPGQEQKLSGPISISSAFGDQNFNRWISFMYLYTGFVIVLNFLPLPKSAMLEVIPLGYEALTKRPFAYKSFRLIRQISIWLLVLLMIWTLVSDIVKLF